MKTFVEMVKRAYAFALWFFRGGDSQSEAFFHYCNQYEVMILLFTYPELTKSQADEIIDLILEGKTAEEIMEEYQLEEREEEFEASISFLNTIPPEYWEMELVEQDMRRYYPEIVDRYWKKKRGL